jgi:hypothetical protein
MLHAFPLISRNLIQENVCSNISNALLQAAGGPVVLGAATSMVALCGVADAPTGGFTIFLRTIAGVFALGMYHGLIVLPVVLVLAEEFVSCLKRCQT